MGSGSSSTGAQVVNDQAALHRNHSHLQIEDRGLTSPCLEVSTQNPQSECDIESEHSAVKQAPTDISTPDIDLPSNDDPDEWFNEKYLKYEKELRLFALKSDNSIDINHFFFFDLPESGKKIYKAELHEEKARRKEERRASRTILYERYIRSIKALTKIPKVKQRQPIRTYTIDDEPYHYDIVRYGRKFYNIEKLHQIFMDDESWYWSYWDDVQYARRLLLTHDEFSEIQSYCHVGNFVDLPHDENMARMKQCVEDILEEPCECSEEHKSQLLRWLSDYPNSGNVKVEKNVDANQQEFPLPRDIKADPTVLRQWTETWEPFDLDIPNGGYAWEDLSLLDEDCGSSKEVIDDTEQIKQYLIKNGVTTEAQDRVRIPRANRRSTNEILARWAKRGCKQPDLAMEAEQTVRKARQAESTFYSDYSYYKEHLDSFASHMKKEWTKFQNLCEQPFVPRTGNLRITKSNSGK